MQSIRTNPNKSEHFSKKLYDDLEPHHQVAVDLRLEGYSYRVISEYLNKESKKMGDTKQFKESLVRQWFMWYGLARHAYDIKKKERNIDRKKLWDDAQDIIQSGALNAIALLTRKVEAGGKDSVKAAETLIRLAGLEPAQKMKHEITEDVRVEKIVVEKTYESKPTQETDTGVGPA